MNAIREANYWWEDGLLPAFPDPPPRRTAILVVGSGCTGITAAIRLRQAGHDVTVIDAKPLGTGASARNGGMVLSGLAADLTTVAKRCGLEAARRLYRESVAAVDAVEALVREGAIDCAFRRTGFLYAAFKPRHAEALKRTRAFMAEQFGHTAQWIPAERIREEVDSPVYHGALLEKEDAGIQPARYIAGLIRMAREMGVNLHENVTALGITGRPGRLTVATDRGPIRAKKVIAATNGYTGALTPWIRRRIVPVRSLMIATALLPPERVRALFPRGRMIADTKTFLYYFRPSPDGRRILFGGRPPFSGRPIAENARHMRNNLAAVFPQLRSVPVEFAWWGKLGFTVDHLPHLGQHEGVYYAAGYCGHGVALATHLGEKLAGLIQGTVAGHSAFAGLKFRAIPFYDGRPWFLPLVYRWFSLRDRLC
jgi:glycine/D-amino acid oxidase-like deaminating enzyme